MLDAANYKLFSHDIRDIAGLQAKLAEFNVSTDQPLLVLTECLLIYLKKEHSVGIINWIGGPFFANSPYVSVLNYEMIKPFDSFG